MTTRQHINRYIEEGNISHEQYIKFLKGVRSFFQGATSYLIEILPLSDPLIMHAQFIDFKKRDSSAKFSDVEFFAIRYSNLLKFSEKEMTRLYDEFADYQLMQLSDIPGTILDEASVK